MAPGCPGRKEAVATFDVKDPEFAQNFEVRTFHSGFVTLAGAVAAIRRSGVEPVAVINAGFFDGNNQIFSYYKSTTNQVEASDNSSLGPRGCAWHDHGTLGFEFLGSTDANYQRMHQAAGAEVVCAGPMLIRHSVDVLDQQICNEHFSPGCRKDRTDGLNYLGNYPRSGVCVTAAGSLKLFAVTSSKKKCGMTMAELTHEMMAAGCTEGLNLDGGGSSKMYYNAQAGASVASSSAGAVTVDGTDPNRGIPVWLVIVRKSSATR